MISVVVIDVQKTKFGDKEWISKRSLTIRRIQMGIDCNNKECLNPYCTCDPCDCTEDDPCHCCISPPE